MSSGFRTGKPVVSTEKPASVLIGTPTRNVEFGMMYVVGLMHSAGIFAGWMPMGGQSDIYVARNTIAGQFLRSPHQSLVFIDSDIGFTREDFKALIETPKPYVSGLYPDKKTAQWVCRDKEHEPIPPEKMPTTGLLEVGLIPCGFLKIDRCVFEAIIASKRVASYGNGTYHQFFNGLVAKDNLLSEDYSFSVLAAECGFPAFVNCAIALEHGGHRIR